ncbi:MAG: tRNA-binding protein [Spirochaetia bacterium]
MIDMAQFDAVEMRVGTILEVREFPEAHKPAYKLRIDFGPELGIKNSSARITRPYSDPEELRGKQVVAVTNLSPRRVGPFVSEVLVLGIELEDQSVPLIVPDKGVPNGARVR